MFRFALFFLLATSAMVSNVVADLEDPFRSELAEGEPLSDASDDRQLRRKSYFRTMRLKVTVTNIAYQQPMSPFFIAVHNKRFPRLYSLGQPASTVNGIREIAEDGNTTVAEQFYSSGPRRRYSNFVGSFADDEIFPERAGAPAGLLFRGESTSFVITVNRKFPLVSMATMAVNTNDCFVGFAHTRLVPGTSFTLPGLDAGTEENNESCTSIPGPACRNLPMRNDRDGNGEGYVHVHRGFHGVNDSPSAPEETGRLTATGYDWRNPMLLVKVSRA